MNIWKRPKKNKLIIWSFLTLLVFDCIVSIQEGWLALKKKYSWALMNILDLKGRTLWKIMAFNWSDIIMIYQVLCSAVMKNMTEGS